MLPALAIPLKIAVSNPHATMLAVGGFISVFWNKIYSSSENGYTFDHASMEDLNNAIKQKSIETKQEIETQVDEYVQEMAQSKAQYNQAVQNMTKDSYETTMKTVPTVNVDSSAKSSLLSEMARSNDNTLKLDNVRNITLENQATMLSELVKQQSLMNELIKGQMMINTERLATEQKQALTNEAIMHIVAEQLPSITLALTQLGSISNTLRNSLEISANNSGVVSRSLEKMSSEHITSATDGFYAKSNEALEFDKSGIESLKDSAGTVVKPREANALASAEKAIETSAMNKSDISEDIGFFEEHLQDLGNPLDILNHLKSSVVKELEAMNISSDDRQNAMASLGQVDLNSLGA